MGLATPLPAIAFILASCTHAPDLLFMCPNGHVVAPGFPPYLLSFFERLAVKCSLRLVDLEEMVWELMTCKHRHVQFFRPAQLDRRGNFNNVTIGPYDCPDLRLPGAAGIPEATAVLYDDFYLYVPNHDTRCFTGRLDFISGVGFLQGQGEQERIKKGVVSKGPRKVITNLGVFDFSPGGRSLRMQTIHPGIEPETVIGKTGFPVIMPQDVVATSPPTREEIKLIREVIDPFSIRDLEFLPKAGRYSKILNIWESEGRQNFDEL
jgi:acyl CoA:acetate/3-ketoacid CoA transferase beta subunit